MKLLNKDPITGLEQHFLYDQLDDVVGLRIIEDYQPLLDFNRFVQGDDEHRRLGIKKGFWRAASIPQVAIYKWLAEDGFNIFEASTKELIDRLNRSENSYLRTTTRKL